MNLYDVSDVVELSGTFTDDAGDLADPTTITLKIKDPSGNITTLTYALSELTRDSIGVYYYNLTIDEAGMWYLPLDQHGHRGDGGRGLLLLQGQSVLGGKRNGTG